LTQVIVVSNILKATNAAKRRTREIAKQTGLTTARLVVLRAIAKLGEVLFSD
jgi:hypothetical protein